MGLFKRVLSAFGGDEHDLVRTGVLARGNVQDVDMTSMSTGRPEGRLGSNLVCTVTVEVIGLGGEDPYVASCQHPVPQVYLPGLMEPGAAVAIRVDPRDPQHIALDLAHDVPAAPTILVSVDGAHETLKTHQGTFTYEDLIRDGRPCTVEVLAVFPLDRPTQAGLPATAVVLLVRRDGAAPYQAQVGLDVPDAAVPVVVPGARLPGKWLPGPGLPTDVNLVTIDFPALQA